MQRNMIKVSDLAIKTGEIILKLAAKKIAEKKPSIGKIKKASPKGVKRSISAKAKSAGAEVMRIAKGIHKASPNKKWASCLKEAGLQYRKKHK